MASERQGWTNGKPFTVTAEHCRGKWGGGDRDWKLRCYLCRTEASEGDTFRWVYMNSSTPSPGNFMVCRTCDFDVIAEAVRASMEDWKKTFGDYAGWSFQAFSKFHSTIFERDQLRAELAAAKEEQIATLTELQSFREHTTALAADNARLREKGFKMRAAISGAWSADRMTSVADSLRPVIQDPECDREALAATPTQSLAAHDAAVKVAVLDQIKARLYSLASKEVDQPYGHDMNPRQWAATCLECAAEDVAAMQEELLAEADRIEKEAENG